MCPSAFARDGYFGKVLCYMKIHVKLLKYSLFYVNIHVMYAVRNFIFDVKIHVTMHGFSLFYVNFQVKFLQVSTILREYSRNVCSAMRNFTFYLKIHVKIMQLFTISRTI